MTSEGQQAVDAIDEARLEGCLEVAAKLGYTIRQVTPAVYDIALDGRNIALGIKGIHDLELWLGII
jgi:hypothetical protein